jgi:hypothetical protein
VRQAAFFAAGSRPRDEKRQKSRDKTGRRGRPKKPAAKKKLRRYAGAHLITQLHFDGASTAPKQHPNNA